MNKIGFIGYGSMAQMIAVKLLDQGKIRDDMVVVSSRNDGKTEELKKLYPNVACQSADELAKQCGLIFICVPPMAVKETLEKYSRFFRRMSTSFRLPRGRA